METCSICYESKFLITVHPSCRFCAECIFNWLKALSSNNKYIDADSMATCPTLGCQSHSPFKLWAHNLPDEYKIHLNDIFLRNYILKKSDMLQCPNPSCEYVGFTVQSHFGCHAPFDCERCGWKWINPIIEGSSDSSWQKFKTFIVKAFSSKRCPYCHTSITRNGGCSSVRCTACGKTFYWYSVFYPGWVVMGLLILIGLLGIISYYYENMINEAANKWVATAGIWTLHLCLVHVWTYIVVRYALGFAYYIQKYYHHLKKLLVIGITLPIGSLIGLNNLMPGYYRYWLTIVGVEAIIAIVFCIIGICLISYSKSRSMRLQRNRRRELRRTMLD